MTTTVKVTAHVSADKEAVVTVSVKGASADSDVHVLQDLQEREIHVFDDRIVTVYERKKA